MVAGMTEHSTDFPAWLSNRTDLSNAAKGLYVTLLHLSHSSEPITIRKLTQRSADGERSVRTALDQLRDAGLIGIGVRRDEHGRMLTRQYTIRTPAD